MKPLVLILSILIFVNQSLSAVNMRNGSYTEKWIDFVDPTPGYEMKVERYYSSRSLFTGLFGFGWCSSLETYINITSDGIVNLTECGAGIEVTYYPEKFDLHSPSQTIEKIITSMKKEIKMTGNDIKNLRLQLQANTKMRFEYANRLHLVDTKKLKTSKNTFVAKAKGLEKIEFDGKIYQRKKHDGTVEHFNKRGQLVLTSNPYGLWLKLNYKGNKLAYLADNKGRRINFSYDSNGTLKKIFNGSGLETTYKFQGDNLVSINNMWSKTYTYSYDGNHNLTAVLFPDKTQIKMSYNVQNDWIKSYTNRIGCKENFNFLLSKKNPKNHYWGTFSRRCKNGDTLSGRHEFWYKGYTFSKDKYLHRAKEIKGSNFRDLYYHPFLGRPVTLLENNEYSGFAYYLNGLINKSEHKVYSEQRTLASWEKSLYKYDLKKYKLIESHITQLNSLGKPLKKYKTYFKYSNKGLLSRAQQKPKRFVAISYNASGQISQLKNEKNETISLGYKPGVAKPVSMKHNSLGEIIIAYDNQGDISSVETRNKRTLASSIIEKFLKMVELLGPMSNQLKI